MVSTSTKFSLNKKTLGKKFVSTHRNEYHSIENPFPLAGKNYFHLQEDLQKFKKMVSTTNLIS